MWTIVCLFCHCIVLSFFELWLLIIPVVSSDFSSDIDYIIPIIFIIIYILHGLGTLQTFASVKSARTAVGHDKDGRVLIMQVDGKTDRNG